MSSTATFGSATDGPVHPAREFFATHNNNVHAEQKRGDEEESLLSYSNTTHVKEKRETEREPFIFPTQQLCVCRKNGEREIGTYNSPGRIFAHRLNTKQAGRGSGRSMDGRACRSRYRR